MTNESLHPFFFLLFNIMIGPLVECVFFEEFSMPPGFTARADKPEPPIKPQGEGGQDLQRNMAQAGGSIRGGVRRERSTEQHNYYNDKKKYLPRNSYQVRKSPSSPVNTYRQKVIL